MKDFRRYWERFEAFERAGSQPAWVASLRRAGMDRFAQTGFPTLDHEDWRFTNLTPLIKLPFRPVGMAEAAGPKLDAVPRFALAEMDALRLVFVNGFYAPQLSALPATGNGPGIGCLRPALSQEAGPLTEHLARHAPVADNPFAALNAAFFQDGGWISVPAHMTVSLPIHLLFVSTADESGTALHPRNLIWAGPGSRVTIVESYIAVGEVPYVTNTVTELVVADGADVEYCKFQDESPAGFHVATIAAHLGAQARFTAHSVATGARLSRNNLRVHLAGEGIECVLNGLYLTRGEQLADHHMLVEHARPHGTSYEYFNGILADKSKGVFHGRILVRPEAQKTDAKQTNKNILLSEEATVNTKPQLEIYADDVKCTHGATVGQLDRDAIFYLRSRGVGWATARRMLIQAFAGEIIERIRHEPLRAALDQLVGDRLEASGPWPETIT